MASKKMSDVWNNKFKKGKSELKIKKDPDGPSSLEMDEMEPPRLNLYWMWWVPVPQVEYYLMKLRGCKYLPVKRLSFCVKYFRKESKLKSFLLHEPSG